MLISRRNSTFRPSSPSQQDGIKEAPHFAGLLIIYLPMPEPGPVGANVDPLGEALGPSAFPEGLWVLFGLAGPRVVEPAVPVVVPMLDDPAVPVPVTELPPAEPVPLCANANVLESANAAASAIVASFMIISLALLTKDNSPATSYVPSIFGAVKVARASVLRGGSCLPSRVIRAGSFAWCHEVA